MNPAIFLLLPLFAAEPAKAEALSASGTVDALNAAFAKHDPARATELLAPDVTIAFVIDVAGGGRDKTMPDESWSGREDAEDFIRTYLPGWEATNGDLQAAGESATWSAAIASDRFRKLGIDRVSVKAEARVRNGEIRFLTLTADPESSAKLMRAIPEGNKAMARRFVEQANKRNYAMLDEIISPMYQQHTMMPVAPGLKGVKDFYAEFGAAFPDHHYVIEDLLVDGDRVVVRMTVRMTHKGEFMGIAATGKAASMQKIDIFRCRGGTTVEHWDAVDRLGLLQQLGVVPKIQRWQASPGYDGFR